MNCWCYHQVLPEDIGSNFSKTYHAGQVTCFNCSIMLTHHPSVHRWIISLLRVSHLHCKSEIISVRSQLFQSLLRHWKRLLPTSLTAFLNPTNFWAPFRVHISRENLLNKYSFMVLILLYVSALDCGKVVCTPFLDLCKAFDSLDHTILLDPLSKLGNELTWFTNYPLNCLQRVKLNGSTSSWTNVQGGIPQGSALGPLLFLVYVTNMPSIIENGKLLQFCWRHHIDLFRCWFWLSEESS